MILDEPMNGLDNQGVEDMRQLLLKLKKETRSAGAITRRISGSCDSRICWRRSAYRENKIAGRIAFSGMDRDCFRGPFS